MAYNAPELLFVGAAQNLVLGSSNDKFDLSQCPFQKEVEDSGPSYDINPLW
jgi:hypothetical protein